MTSKIGVFVCGPKLCEHQWDGPELREVDPCASCGGTGKVGGVACTRCHGSGEGGGSSSSTCSRCGIDAMTVSLWSDE